MVSKVARWTTRVHWPWGRWRFRSPPSSWRRRAGPASGAPPPRLPRWSPAYDSALPPSDTRGRHSTCDARRLGSKYWTRFGLMIAKQVCACRNVSCVNNLWDIIYNESNATINLQYDFDCVQNFIKANNTVGKIRNIQEHIIIDDNVMCLPLDSEWDQIEDYEALGHTWLLLTATAPGLGCLSTMISAYDVITWTVSERKRRRVSERNRGGSEGWEWGEGVRGGRGEGEGWGTCERLALLGGRHLLVEVDHGAAEPLHRRREGTTGARAHLVEHRRHHLALRNATPPALKRLDCRPPILL